MGSTSSVEDHEEANSGNRQESGYPAGERGLGRVASVDIKVLAGCDRSASPPLPRVHYQSITGTRAVRLNFISNFTLHCHTRTVGAII
jgi:hypothetical protein